GEYPAGESDGPQIEANLAYVQANFMSCYGTPYKIVRIPMPPSTSGAYPASGGYYRTYTNHVIVNKTIIVPGYRTEYDTTAQRILEDCYPGYTIKFIDVDNTGANLISQSGAIHCITNNIGVDNPLLIRHQELTDTYDDVNPYTVTAFIKHISGINTATLYYSTDGGTAWSNVGMASIGSDNFTANIPAQPVGTHVLYYIQANAVSGKTQVRPMVAPTGNFDFYVLGTTGINNNLPANAVMNIFPNPAGAITCIDLTNVSGNITVTLQNLLGQHTEVLFSGNVDMNKKVFFNASQYEAGTYLVKVNTANGVMVSKVIVK
ncbi:MAG TPA: agmatine deiminase family protein, partial [Flavobacteriales bacterium]|nr:agmatine deiminase family protein [Flavobacteriales bacterium]